MVRKISKDYLGSHLKIEQLSYTDYVLFKGCLTLVIEGLEPSHLLEKNGSSLNLGGEFFDLKFRSIGDVVDLIRNYDENLILKVEENFHLSLLDNLSALYLADFSSRSFRIFDLTYSTLPLSRVKIHKDKLGNLFNLEDYNVLKKYSKKLKKAFTAIDRIEIEDFEENLEIRLEYRATELNLYTLHEIPLSHFGKEGISLFEGL